ncbi:MAG: deoxyribonuclease IV, partial [Elusimicrobiaceae bacterium]|nr:deoxyribonuclease IV [Elusimicrobiaceae bacterium]
VDTLNKILTPNQHTTVLLETMAGKGSEIGRSFDELKRILDGVKLNRFMGVCLDTCHINDAGYSIAKLDDTLAEFDKQIGLKLLKAVHLNDSLNPQGSHKDRHAKIGEGTIGTKLLAGVINHPALKHLPFCLETPNELDGYAAEIKLLRSLYRE